MRTSHVLIRSTLLTILLLLAPAAAHAQLVKPWVPPASDSLIAMAAEARVSFRANRGDSIGGPNFHAYEVVGRMALRLVRTIGPSNMVQAPAIETVLDSLGLDTSVAVDPRNPRFVLVMVHNPYLPSASSVGFLYWFAGETIRWQGTVYRGGREPRMRIWWTGVDSQPYRCVVLDQVRGDPIEHRFTLLGLSAAGRVWTPVQYEGNGPDLTAAREAQFVDLNRDGVPEIAVWTASAPDSLFENCRACPAVLTEQLWVERGGRFQLEDSRLVPSPWSTFVVFIQLLRQGNRSGAARLLADPAQLDVALREGWATGSGRGLYAIEDTDPSQRWPEWFTFRFRGAKGHPRYTVRFTQRDQRWVIQEWEREGARGVFTPARPGGKRP